MNCTARADQQSFWQTAQCESHPARGGTCSRCLPSWLSPDFSPEEEIRNFRWLDWKWLESQSNCILSLWKDKCLINLLFWISIFFQIFQDYGRRHPLTARHKKCPMGWDSTHLYFPWDSEIEWECQNVTELSYLDFTSLPHPCLGFGPFFGNYWARSTNRPLC